MLVDELDTPIVTIDLDRVERNLGRWQRYCDEHGLRNRPHMKTHKVVELAKLQLAKGAKGICCQKLGEAEVMAAGGIDDILVPFNLLGSAKLARARDLADRITLEVACDSLEVARGLSEAFAGSSRPLAVLIECDTGAKRCGVQTPEAATDLALAVDRLPGLRFSGLMSYPPKGEPSAAAAFFGPAKAMIERHGLAVEKLSSAGSPDMWKAHESGIFTEYRVGTYIYYDRMQVAAGAATLDDCALHVQATVVSRPHPDRAILDAGSKALTSDIGGQDGHGLIVQYPEARIFALSEEHAHVDISRCAMRPKVGEKVAVVPNHACPVSNLFDTVVGVRDGRVVETFQVAARGRVR